MIIFLFQTRITDGQLQGIWVIKNILKLSDRRSRVSGSIEEVEIFITGNIITENEGREKRIKTSDRADNFPGIPVYLLKTQGYS